MGEFCDITQRTPLTVTKKHIRSTMAQTAVTMPVCTVTSNTSTLVTFRNKRLGDLRRMIRFIASSVLEKPVLCILWGIALTYVLIDRLVNGHSQGILLTIGWWLYRLMPMRPAIWWQWPEVSGIGCIRERWGEQTPLVHGVRFPMKFLGLTCACQSQSQGLRLHNSHSAVTTRRFWEVAYTFGWLRMPWSPKQAASYPSIPLSSMRRRVARSRRWYPFSGAVSLVSKMNRPLLTVIAGSFSSTRC